MRRATIRTTHEDDDATLVARSLAPDNTDEMETRTEGDRVVTTVARESTSGLRSTVDDYVVNCRVATRLGEGLDASGSGPDRTDEDGDGSEETRRTATTNDTPDTDTNT